MRGVQHPTAILGVLLDGVEYQAAFAGGQQYAGAGHQPLLKAESARIRVEEARVRDIVKAIDRSFLVTVEPSAVAEERDEVRRGTIDGPDRRIRARQDRKYNRTPNASEGLTPNRLEREGQAWLYHHLVPARAPHWRSGFG